LELNKEDSEAPKELTLTSEELQPTPPSLPQQPQAVPPLPRRKLTFKLLLIITVVSIIIYQLLAHWLHS
jgi:hypothetical protein